MIEREEELGMQANYLNENFELLKAYDDKINDLQQGLNKLKARRTEIHEGIISAIGHDHDGQRTYQVLNHKVVIKTLYKHVVNKDKYESGVVSLPEQYNPIEPEVVYKINKKKYNDYIQFAPQEVKDALSLLITTYSAGRSVEVEMNDE